MIAAVQSGSLNLEKLEAMTAICSVGLDMIAIPEDTPYETIAAMIADEAAIGVINQKTTAVDLLTLDEFQEVLTPMTHCWSHHSDEWPRSHPDSPQRQFVFHLLTDRMK